MCGIFGYIGSSNTKSILIRGLKKLEYRGYDSSGIAVPNGNSFEIIKEIGKIAALEKKLQSFRLSQSVGIAHTRWSTHGSVNIANAHPHTSNDRNNCIVHNGIIDNSDNLKKALIRSGYEFYSETDTEVIANLLQKYRKKTPLETIKVVMKKLKGTFGLAILFADHPDKIFFAKNGSPLVIGNKDNEKFLSSDANTLIEHTNQVVYLNDKNYGWISKEHIEIHSLSDNIPEQEEISLEDGTADLEGFPHYMLKEICEQGEAIKRCLGGRVLGDTCKLGGFGLSPKELSEIESVTILACGTSYHSGLVAKYFIEGLSGVTVYVELASEFLSKRFLKRKNGIYIAISQSGETYDVLECLKELETKGCSIYGIVNTVGGSIPRLCKKGAYIHAGPEIAVASTKAFTSQIAALFIFAIMLARTKELTQEDGEKLCKNLKLLPKLFNDYTKKLVGNTDIVEISNLIAGSKYVLFLGRGSLFPVALEGALKLKEITYIPCEAYTSGEMKHGPIAMISSETPVICLLPKSGRDRDKVITAIKEVHSRGARIILIHQGKSVSEAEFSISVPDKASIFSNSLFVVSLQLISYYTALKMGKDIDKPRNLAKSVTV